MLHQAADLPELEDDGPLLLPDQVLAHIAETGIIAMGCNKERSRVLVARLYFAATHCDNSGLSKTYDTQLRLRADPA